jgi:hypothetical protein
MPEPYRLKLKIGQFEFEAEGDPQVVHEQFQAFKELIAMQPPLQAPVEHYPAALPAPSQAAPVQQDASPYALDFEKIARRDERVVSLTVRPSSTQDAILLLLLGQKLLRGNDSVTGSEIISGLSATGGLYVQRPDRVLEKLARDGDVIAFGEGRAKRYRLTNTGLSKARELAAIQIATVA